MLCYKNGLTKFAGGVEYYRNMVYNMKRVKIMKNYFKNITVILLALCLLSFCGCKSGGTLSSEMTASETDYIQTELNNIAEDETVDPENTETAAEPGVQMSFKNIQAAKGQANGIDVSKWQGKINWQSVKNAGIDFAVIRMGYRGENGVIYRDSNADYNIQQAQKVGILVGVYFFSTAVNTSEATEEAAWVCEAVKGYDISYPVVYDCEGYTDSSSRMYGVSAASRTDNALAFADYVHGKGYTGMVYGAKSEFENPDYWQMERIEQKCRIWVAHYSSPTYPDKPNPDYNRKYDMWQYTNRGTVDGVSGNCDMVVSYFTAERSSAKDNSATPPAADAPKTQEEMVYTEINDRVTAKEEVNLRTGAGTKYDIAGSLKSGEFLTRTGIGTNGWSRLLYNGQTVYAITSYLSNEIVNVEKPDVVDGQIFTAAGDRVTAKSEVNLRALPTTDSNIVGSLKSGTFLMRTAIGDKGWSRLDFNGTAVYAVTNYLTDKAPEISSDDTPSEQGSVTEYGMEFKLTAVNVTAKEEVNLRDKPETGGSNVVYTLKNGEYITKTGESNSGWARLDFNGQTVYAINSFLMQ